MRKAVVTTAAAVVVLTSCRDARMPEPLAPVESPSTTVLAAGAQPGDSIPGEWIVLLSPTANATGVLQRVLQLHGAHLEYIYRGALKGFSVRRLAPPAVAALRRDSDISSLEPNRWGGIAATQTNATWGLDRIDQRDLPLSTDYTYHHDGTGVNAYVLDTGIRLTHAEFGGRAAYIPNGANGDFVGDAAGNANDCHGHGTHVAGTIGGATYGVAKNVTLWAGRVVNCQGGGTLSMVLAALDWVTLHGERPAVVNMSLAYGNVPSLRTAVENSIAAGVNYAVAAGNGNAFGVPQDACLESPAGAPSANTVGATTSADAEASWSNGGPCVDILAPGVSIRAASHTSNTATITMSGTSMASPHVAGVIALVLQAFPNHSPAQVSAALSSNASVGRIDLHGFSSSNGTPNRLLFMGFLPSATPKVPPVANFVFSCAGRTCNFDSRSTDADGTIVAHAWQFGDGRASMSPSPSHTFATAGTYSVALTATDNDGQQHARTVAVTVGTGGNQSPLANFRSSCTGSTCSFTNLSSDAGGTITAHAWRFGDGATSTAKSPSHSYAATGTYAVTLAVTDDGGATHWQTLPVVVGSPNAAPFASYTFPVNGATVTLTNHSTDSDGAVTSSLWELGDGTTYTTPSVIHTYPASGVYNIRLTVRDNAGAEHSRSRQVTAQVAAPPPTVPPQAKFSLSCAARTCSFNDESTDADGRIVSVAWEFGDGARGTEATVSHTYAAGGTFNVRLTVSDDDGLSHSATVPVTVSVIGSNQPPTGNFRYDPRGARRYDFTSLSADGDGTISAHHWDFGDGATSSAQNPSHVYATPGTYRVTLRVADNGGARHWQSVELVVVDGDANKQPFASFTFPVSGRTVTLTDHSSDADGSVTQWRWRFGDGATSNTRHASHTFAAAGVYLVTLSVTDNAGRVHARTRLVTVH